MIYVFDIDDTICTKSVADDYSSCSPIKERINIVNRLYDEGHTIIMMTARGMCRSKGNQNAADELMREITEAQLSDWGVKYNDLYFGKPFADFYIDDKAINDKDFFQ